MQEAKMIDSAKSCHRGIEEKRIKRKEIDSLT